MGLLFGIMRSNDPKEKSEDTVISTDATVVVSVSELHLVPHFLNKVRKKGTECFNFGGCVAEFNFHNEGRGGGLTSTS